MHFELQFVVFICVVFIEFNLELDLDDKLDVQRDEHNQFFYRLCQLELLDSFELQFDHLPGSSLPPLARSKLGVGRCRRRRPDRGLCRARQREPDGR